MSDERKESMTESEEPAPQPAPEPRPSQGKDLNSENFEGIQRN